MTVKVHHGEGKLQQIIEIGPHRILADEPRTVGGEETGPTPHDLLAAALGACTALTVTMYARHKKIDLQDVEVEIEHEQQNDAYVLRRRIRYVGDLSLEQHERLIEITNKCPLHKILSGQIKIETETV
jgi:putative redox protein